MKFSRETARLLTYLRPHVARLFGGVVLLGVAGTCEGLVALMLIPAIDVILNPHSTQQKLELVKKLPFTDHPIYLNSFFPASIHYVWTIFAISLCVLFVVKAAAEFLGNVLVQYVGHAGIMDLRNSVYGKLVQQPMEFFQHNPTGRVMSAVINDVEQMRSAFSEYLADFFRQVFMLVTFVSILLILNWTLAIGSAIFIPLVLGPVSKLGRRIRRSSETSRTRLSDLSQIVQETMSGNRVVKAFGMEGFEIRKFRDAAAQLLRENMRWVRAYAASSPIMDILSAVVFAILILYARSEINHGIMTLGQFVAFVYALFKVYEPVKRLGGIYQLFQQALGASAVVFQFLDLAEEVPEAPGLVALPEFRKQVTFDNVGFAYELGREVLHDINLSVPAGSVIAVVGSSGAGKTTLVNLLPRFHAPTSGAVKIDGLDLDQVTLRSLREQIAIVTQETILFNDTVWSNLSYGRPEMPEARVIAASKAALAHDFITQLPQGYQTKIGDRGQRLSGGQRQRLAIARALIKDAPILILDEATSELDSESELLVQKALNNLMSGRTVFVIAHRLSTIRRADLIAVLEGGTISELGTHEQLLAHGATYRRLYEMQFRDADLPVTAPGPM